MTIKYDGYDGIFRGVYFCGKSHNTSLVKIQKYRKLSCKFCKILVSEK